MNSIPRGEVQQALFLERRKPKLDERFIVTIDQKDFVVYVNHHPNEVTDNRRNGAS